MRKLTLRTERREGEEENGGTGAHEQRRRQHAGAVIGVCERVKVRGFVRVCR